VRVYDGAKFQSSELSKITQKGCRGASVGPIEHFLFQKMQCVSGPRALKPSPAYACQDNAYAEMAPLLCHEPISLVPETLQISISDSISVSAGIPTATQLGTLEVVFSFSFSTIPICNSNPLRKLYDICFTGRLYPIS
jgi:hypothetical protein